MATDPIPYIDPNIEHVGVSRLRKLNAGVLRENRKTFVIQENDTPLAVLLAYEQFLSMQRKIQSLAATIELLSDEEETRGLLSGIQDAREGRTRKLSDIRKSLKNER
jgi:PHD/YefM family antitoxin component YafN of YafNO toxin-antitoxin module